MSTPPPRGLAPKPPEKGVFPLDHFGECKEVRRCSLLSSLLAAVGGPGRVAVVLLLLPISAPSPPDRLRTCTHQIKDRYLKCLSEHHADAEACRQLTKEYLQCRMER